MPSIVVLKETTDNGEIRKGKVDIGETSVDKSVILKNMPVVKTTDEQEPGTYRTAKGYEKIEVGDIGKYSIKINPDENTVERQVNGKKYKITNQNTINQIKARARRLRLLKAEKENKGSKGASRTSKEK